jgi:hypothetical protein
VGVHVLNPALIPCPGFHACASLESIVLYALYLINCNNSEKRPHFFSVRIARESVPESRVSLRMLLPVPLSFSDASGKIKK